MFDVELALAEAGSKSHTIILRRDYQEFRALHLALDNLITSSKVRITFLTEYGFELCRVKTPEGVHKLSPLPSHNRRMSPCQLCHNMWRVQRTPKWLKR
jgi:hypothetical protein